MAIIAGGIEPTTDGERRLIRKLKDELPANYLIYHNFELKASSGQSFEYDVMVVGDNVIYVIEDKCWHGEIKGNDTDIILNGGKVMKNPLTQATRLSKILKTYLIEKDRFLSSAWVQELINFSGNDVKINIQGNSRSRMTTLDTVIDFIKDPSKLTGAGKPTTIINFKQSVQRYFKHLSFLKPANKQIHEYCILETKEQNELYKEYTAYDINLGESSKHVILREFFMDPYLSSRDQLKQMALLKRDYKALEALRGNNQIITPRAGFEPNGDSTRFVVVYNAVKGVPLIEWFLNEKKIDEEKVKKLLHSTLRAIDVVHKEGLLHRNLTPNALIVENESIVYLQNFEYSRLPNGEATIATRVSSELLEERYTDPTIIGDISRADKATDLYSLGCIFYDLLQGSDKKPITRKNGQLAEIDGVQDSDLQKVILKLSHYNLDNRYESAEQALDDLGYSDRVMTSSIKDFYEVGDRIDNRYQVVERLGGGAFSNVYRAYYEPGDEYYAIKIMKNQKGNIEAVKAEYKRLKELSHEFIAKVKDVDSVGGGAQYLLKMEYIQGKSLDKLMKESSFTINKIVSWAKQLLSALCYLQEQHPPIIHSDIKPANIMIREDGRAVLIDFNVSQTSEDAVTMAGTRKYMAPDAIQSKDDLSKDLFSLGVVIFELLSGAYPFQDNIPKISSEVKEIKNFRDNVSNALARWLKKACEPLMENRFVNANDMLDSLKAIDAYIEEKAVVEKDIEMRLNQLPVLGDSEKYYNKLMPYFQSFYSQSPVGNSGTRGLDEFARVTYVDTYLDTRLTDAILSGKYSLIIITGNAGDGKTAFIHKLEGAAAAKGENVNYYVSKNGSEFSIEGIKVITNYDGSQDEGDKENNEVLYEFFKPYSNGAILNATEEVRIIAINEGRLMEFLQKTEGFGEMSDKIRRYLQLKEKSEDGLLVVNLNWRSVVAKQNRKGQEDSIVEKLLDKYTDPIFFKSCESCISNKNCPILHNVKIIRDEAMGKEIKEQVRGIFEVVHLRKKFHITMRDIRSALSYIIFGTKSCAEISQLLASEASKEAQYELISMFYYNRLFNWHTSEPSKDRLMQQLGEIDVAEVAHAKIDRNLSLMKASEQTMYQNGDLVSQYDLRLLDSLYGYMPVRYADFQDEFKIGVYRDFIKISKRKYYCEGFNHAEPTDIHKLLPYENVKSFMELLSGQGDLQEAKRFVVKSVSNTEQVKNKYADGFICLRENKLKGSSILTTRLFPQEEFELSISHIGEASAYIEYMPDSLELKYKKNGRIKFVIGLDIFELLDKVSKGYVPTVHELRGVFVNLTVFKNQLSSIPYDSIILSEDEKQFYQIERKKNKLYLKTAEGVEQ